MNEGRFVRHRALAPLVVIATVIIAVVGFIYQVMDNPNLQGCTLFGAPSRLTLSVIVLIALVGWIFAIHQVLPLVVQAYLGPTNSPAAASDAELLAAIRTATSLDIFGSSSERLRSLLHVHCRSLPSALSIRVLLRDDDTPGRRAKLQDQAIKWKSEIGPRVANVQLRMYRYDPLMFRGVIIDSLKAVLGWYYRGNPLRQGEDLDWFWIEHTDTIGSVSKVFNDLFDRGEAL